MVVVAGVREVEGGCGVECQGPGTDWLSVEQHGARVGAGTCLSGSERPLVVVAGCRGCLNLPVPWRV